MGDILSLEGGAARSLFKGFGYLGMSYYAQWKMTEDKGLNLAPALDAKHRYYGIGPDLTVPVPLGKKGARLATIRYLFETGNRGRLARQQAVRRPDFRVS